jgi:hypothetical protein
MEKTYIKPEASAHELALEGVVAASLKIDNEKTVDTSNGGQLSNKYKSPWDSSNWAN